MTTTAQRERTPHVPMQVDVQAVTVLRPFTWLWRGAQDFVRCWPGNVAHGFLMAALGWVLLLMLGNHPYFVSAAVSGFLLGAPVMTTGICELSRRRAAGEPLGFDASLTALGREGPALLRFGIVLGIVAVVWFALSELMLQPVFGVAVPDVAETYYSGFLDEVNRRQVTLYLGIGAVLAAIVFLLSVVTVPIIIDRGMRAGEAMRASLRTVAANPAAMVVWAALIVALTAAGFATLLAGMIVLIPLLGHATWHAYRDLVR